MDWQAVAAVVHVLAAVTALVMGAVVLGLPKGVGAHRLAGGAYVFCLVIVDVAALSVHREARFGVFHALAVLSLLTIGVGVSPLLLGIRSPVAIYTHAYCMTWSYAGLVAAGCGQLAVAFASGLGSWTVPTVIATVLSISGLLIFFRVPPIVANRLTAVARGAVSG